MPTPPELPEIGTRISLRYLRPPGSDPAMGDALGHLVAVQPLVQVRSADGVLHEFRRDDVLYVRQLTDRPVKNSAIRAVEHAAALGCPGAEHEWLDGWFLRATPGADPGANSAVPLDMYAHTRTVAAIIDWYGRRGLPPRLAVPERLLRVADDIPTVRQTRTLIREVIGGAADAAVVLAAAPDADWLAIPGDDTPAAALTAVVDGEVVFATIPGVGAARGSVTEGSDGSRWLGITALRVGDEHRRRGHARVLAAALEAWAHDRGATRAFLQADSTDADALGFAQAIGFAGQHRTRYLDALILRP